jgi:sarcosine oxidase subunit alpha
VFTSGDDGWKTLSDLAAAGIGVAAVIDARNDVPPALLAAAQRVSARVFTGAHVADARGSHGIHRISIRAGNRIEHVDVDGLAVSGGWNPCAALTTHVGGRPRWSETISAFVPGDLPAGMSVAGAAGGSLTLEAALREGAAAGAEAAAATGFAGAEIPSWRTSEDSAAARPFWHVGECPSKAFVDFQHDVTDGDIALAAREGYRSVELLKRYTTLGMATDQGKTSSLNGHAIMAALTERSIPEVGTTTARPPYTPVAIGAFAGHHRGKEFKPTRLTAGHAWARQNTEVFVEAGQWLRAQWFPRPGEHDWLESVSREVKAVRSSAGVCDVSTLGKIDIQGADAGAFLDRVYINTFSTLPMGKVRYGLMLREDGFVMDDGTTARLGETHYVMSTTTANAAKVMQHLEHARQVLWPELDVQMVSVTEQWAQYAVAGPSSRRLLEGLLGDVIDLSNTAFPYLACAQLAWRGVPVRLFRISFSGEMAYEIAIPARHGDALIRAIMTAGQEFGAVPYGTEALGVMRIEKGHVAGNELNGTTTAADLGLGRMLSKKKDCIGRVLAGRPALLDPERPTLVGVRPVDRKARLYAGAHFLAVGAATTLENDQGYVTSVAYSPMLEGWIGLGLLARGPSRHGERLVAHSPVRGGDTEVEVVSPIFFDPEGTRLHG